MQLYGKQKMLTFVRNCLYSENDFEAVLVNFCCYGYGANASEAVQKISTRTLLELCQLTKTANFKAASMKKHLAVYYQLIGDTSQVSVFFSRLVKMSNLLQD